MNPVLCFFRPIVRIANQMSLCYNNQNLFIPKCEVTHMQIVDYFAAEQPATLIDQIEAGQWGAAKFLAKLLREGSFRQAVGAGTVYLLMDGEQLVSFVTLTHQDCVRDEALYPWLGFFYTFPAYRGHRYGGQLLDHAVAQAAKQGHSRVYLATDHVGLYEKYGFTYWQDRLDIYGDNSRIYIKATSADQ